MTQLEVNEFKTKWAAVLKLIREYDEAFPYASQEDDDKIVTSFDKLVQSL